MQEAESLVRPPARGLSRARVACWFLGLLLLMGAAAWLAWGLLHGWTCTKVERLIQAEVPPDCDRGQVEAWFERHDIPHGYFEGTTGTSSFNVELALRLGLKPEDVSGVEHGDISEANEHFLFPSDISIYFVFDSRRRLAGHLVDAMIYGP
jgi:hypothetical protein